MPLKKKFPVKIGIMGGGFNPFHLGHLNSLLTMQEIFSFQKIVIIPAFQPPLSEILIKNSARQRLEMLEQALDSYSFMEIDNQEIKRKGKSYSYRTIENLYKKNPKKELFFILGLDQFQIFDQWKEFERIIKKSNLIVTSRSPFKFPKNKKEIPEGLQKFIKTRSVNKINLTTGYSIYFQSLKDKNISSSLVRKKIKDNKRIESFVPKSISQYIKKNNLYQSDSSNRDLKTFLNFCVQELEDKKAFDIKTFDLTLRSVPFSAGLIASSSNIQHCKALSRHLQKRIQQEFKSYPLGKEGQTEGRWIVLDYNDIVIHIFYNYVRDSYNLEKIWKSSSEVNLKN